MSRMKLKIPFLPSKPSVAVVKMSGVISAGARAGLCDQTLSPILEKAFKKGQHQAVALLINSPGGSPVQSSLISSRIKRLAEENDMPVFAFVEDVAAATSSTNANTGISFSSAKRFIRELIKEDWTGDPPGELINKATAWCCPFLKAFSKIGLKVWSHKPARAPAEITPDILTTATLGLDGKKGIFNFIRDT